VKAAFLGAFVAAFVLLEVWANLNPVRVRLGLPETLSAAVDREPRRVAKDQHTANDQGDAEPGTPTAAPNPGSDPTSHNADDGKGLDWPAWIQAASAVVSGIATVALVSITSRQAGLAESQVEISRLQVVTAERQAALMASQNDLRTRPEINALIRSKISEPYQGVKVIEFDHLSPDGPLALPSNALG